MYPSTLRFAVFGAGFWTPYQLAGWREVGGVECVAIYNRTRAKAETTARQFGIPGVFDDPERLLSEVRPDFVDNITEIGGHAPLSLLCARKRIPCICQKPLAETLADAESWTRSAERRRASSCTRTGGGRPHCSACGLRAGTVGPPLRARLTMLTSD